jgi:hypothetical protein
MWFMSYLPLSSGHLPWQEEETVRPTVSRKTLYCDLMLQYTECIQTAWTNFRNEFPTPKQGKELISVYVRKHPLEVQPPRSPDFSPFHISVTKAFFMPEIPHATAARHLTICDTPRSDVSMRVEGILNICCQYWPDKNPTVKTLETCTEM